MNNKGFAITTIIYSVILLLSISTLLVLAIVKSEYRNQRDYISEIDQELEECLEEGTC